MSELKIKSNGLRNELKEIRHSIDRLTLAIMAQTNKRDEQSNDTPSCRGELCECDDTYKKHSGKETGRSFGI